MLALIFSLAAANNAALITDGEARAAIWEDVEWLAVLGGSLTVTADWAQGVRGGKAPTLKIENLLCAQHGDYARCRFQLRRVIDGPLTPEDLEQPARLSCSAEFRPYDDGWHLVHTPPGPEGGHTRTTLACTPVS